MYKSDFMEDGRKPRASTPSEAPQHERILVTISSTGTLILLIWALWMFRFGFDFTDEGFYLNWISTPFNYTVSISQFGFIYHPLYLIVDGNITLLRQANFLISFALAWLLAWQVLGLIAEREGSTITLPVRTAASAALATSTALSVVFAGLWLPTPSYNTLTYQGLLLTAIGLVLARPDRRWGGIVGWVVLALGGWLTFMGKPTSAAVVAVLIGAFLLISRRLRLVPFLTCLTTVAMLIGLSAMIIDGSISQFLNRYIEGTQVTQALGGGHSFAQMFRLEGLKFRETQSILMIGLVLASGLAIFVASFHLKPFPQVGSLAALLTLFIGLSATIRIDDIFVIHGSRRGLSVLAIAPGIVLAAMLSNLRRDVRPTGKINVFLAFILTLFPYAYAFGTGNEYWIPIACAATFVFLAAHLFYIPLACHPRCNAILLVGVASVQAITAVFAYCGTLTPYRQPHPLTQNNVEVTLGNDKFSLLLSSSHAEYFVAGERLLSQAGFEPGTPMIDLTGHSPGFLFAMGANSVGLPWTLGGYPGSDSLVAQSLTKVPCEQLTKAWILTEPSGPRPISSTVLESFGASITRDYRIIGELVSQEGQRQVMYAPHLDMTGVEDECIHKRKQI